MEEDREGDPLVHSGPGVIVVGADWKRRVAARR